MRAAVFERFGGPVEVREVPDPAPAPDGVVLEVGATGLCRSDWHGWMGHDPAIAVPHVPGHELAGTVVAVGRDVTRWKPGDRVTVPFVCGCGTCAECHAGHAQVCEAQAQPGFTHWGSFAERVALRHADGNLVALPEYMEFATAASLGCRFATAFRAVVDRGRVRPGEWVAVHGCGGVGLSAIMIAAACGARVVGVDLAPGPLEMARNLGAEAIDARGDVPEIVREVTGGGAHLSLDALGHRATAWNSVLCLRRRGRHVQVGLLEGPHADPPLPMGRVIGWELDLLGTHGMQAHRYGAMLEMVRAGRLRPDLLVRERIALDEAPARLVAMDADPPVGAVVIDRF